MHLITILFALLPFSHSFPQINLPSCPRFKQNPIRAVATQASVPSVSPPFGFAHPQAPLLVNISQFFKEEFETRRQKVWLSNPAISILIHKSNNVLYLFQGSDPKEVGNVDISDLPVYDTSKSIAHAAVGLFLVLQGDNESTRTLSTQDRSKIQHLHDMTLQTINDLSTVQTDPVVMQTLKNVSDNAGLVLAQSVITKDQVQAYQSSLRASMFALLDIGAREQTIALWNATVQLLKQVPLDHKLYAISAAGLPRGNPSVEFFVAALGRRGEGDGVYYSDATDDQSLIKFLQTEVEETRLIFGDDLTMSKDAVGYGTHSLVDSLTKKGVFPLRSP